MDNNGKLKIDIKKFILEGINEKQMMYIGILDIGYSNMKNLQFMLDNG